MGEEGVRAITAWSRNLTSLRLGNNNIGDEGAKAIATTLPNLALLDLSYNNIGDEGVKAIAAALPNLTSLLLSGNNVAVEGAKAIAAALPNLTTLDVDFNDIGDEGAKAIAAALPKLTSLRLWRNNIGDEGAKAIAAALPGLTLLDLDDNNIGDEGAKAIAAALPRLSILRLKGNYIGEAGAKAIAAALPHLSILSLNDNNIGPAGAKAIAAALSNLTTLDLSNNNIGVEGTKALLDAWLARGSSRLYELRLNHNGDISGLLPEEVLATSDPQAILAAYRSFVVAQHKKTLKPLNELKLLVVGNEAVGKTSLLRYLITGKPRDPAEPKTPGITQREKIEVQGWSPHRSQVRLNVWDFGGQEMMRGTHRFFLTERSLYLLVLEDRRQDDRSVYDWMKTIRNRGGVSPVIVVINKSDNPGKQDLRLDENGLQQTYGNIVAFLRTSCNPGDWAEKSIEDLRLKIVDVITQNEHLKRIREPIPANWIQIKNRVRELADQHPVLTHADFVALCKAPGAGTDPIIEENEQRAVLRLLNELGTIVAHGLERDSPATRREINLLDPNWLTGAIYCILEKASSVDQQGEFLRRQLGDWLDPGLYPLQRHEFILDMMLDRDIGLCFRLPVPQEERYLVPEALPGKRPLLTDWPEDSLRFRYEYGYLPPSLIPRFIVETHRDLPPGKSRWRTGVVLGVRGCEVLVVADPDRWRIDLQVAGPSALRRPALNIVLNHLDAVHTLNPEAEPVAYVPLPDRPEHQVSYEHLLMLEQLKGPNFEFFPERINRTYLVKELLDGVRRDRQAERRSSREEERADPKVTAHVVVLVHGIRDYALWQNSIRSSLEYEGFKCEPTNYNYFNLVKFVLPVWYFRRQATEEIWKQVRIIAHDNPNTPMSVIAHSFGTFVVSYLMKKGFDLKFHRIIFCGSVVPYNFEFEQIENRFNKPIINEVGTRDIWPALAESITFGYGSAGTYGFRPALVRDRWHNKAHHGYFLDAAFCKKYWVPFLNSGEIVQISESAESPRPWLRVLSIAQIKYILITIAVVLVFMWLRGRGYF
jgi:small GTP-binding protein